jgi:hypothetical protein
VVEHAPQAVDVTAFVNGMLVGVDVLGAHVVERSHDDVRPRQAGAVEDAGQSEVAQLRNPVLRDEDVARLDVPMDDVSRVGVGESLGDLATDSGGPARVVGLVVLRGRVQEGVEGGALHVLLDHHVDTVRGLEAVDGDDVGMREAGGGLRLLLESGDGPGGGCGIR